MATENSTPTYDQPSYPDLGNIYPGDYYPDIPWQDYIRPDQPLPQGKAVFDIRDFGAVAEPGRLNTAAFQKAADAAAANGGGVILVAGGIYRMGTVWIPSHTTLFVAADACLEASRNADLLLDQNPHHHQKYGTESAEGAFIRVRDAEDVVITGGGRISGSGEWYVYEPRELPALEPFALTRLPRRDQAACINTVPGTVRYYYRQRIRYAEDKYQEGRPNLRRPSYMVWVENSRQVQLENIILHDAMCWTLNIDCCEQVVIRDLVIDDNRHVANTDGIDLTGSSHVAIEHCFISCADDGICLKNPVHTGRTMRDIEIHRCTVLSVMNAFKIGTGTRHDICQVRVSDCDLCLPDIYPGSVSGISIESCDGSYIKDVVLDHIRMDKIMCPVYLLLNQRNEALDPYTEEPDQNAYWGGGIADITIKNLSAPNAELPCIVTGFINSTKTGRTVRKAIRGLKLEHIDISYRDNQEEISLPEQFTEFLT
ncbi:MAG: glycosyl hydrolase family 28 protein, partial [Oscillospiraceae bacterium]|nr:glycosyl hydrolase family 28 protein [Oscillospiraceae bacterium]